MLEAANAYFSGTISGDRWDAFSDDDQTKALNEAQKVIALLPIDKVPDNLLNAAIYEQAFCILAMPEETKKRLLLQLQGVVSVKAGNASESYQSSESRSSLSGFALCPKVEAMLLPYVTNGIFKSGLIERARYPKRFC